VAASDLDLHEIRLLVDEPELRIAPGPHVGARADLKLEIAPIAGVELVARRHGRVDLRRSPVLTARAEVGNFAVGVAQPGRRAPDCVIIAVRRLDGSEPQSHLGDEREHQNR
jgi:hypothetical protein